MFTPQGPEAGHEARARAALGGRWLQKNGFLGGGCGRTQRSCRATTTARQEEVAWQEDDLTQLTQLTLEQRLLASRSLFSPGQWLQEELRKLQADGSGSLEKRQESALQCISEVAEELYEIRPLGVLSTLSRGETR